MASHTDSAHERKGKHEDELRSLYFIRLYRQQQRWPDLHLLHINNAPDAVTSVHVVESTVNTAQVLAVSNELVDLELAGHVVIDETGELSAAFDASEGAAFPAASGDELES